MNKKVICNSKDNSDMCRNACNRGIPHEKDGGWCDIPWHCGYVKHKVNCGELK